jgi:two-component system sensor histidine kinase HydH
MSSSWTSRSPIVLAAVVVAALVTSAVVVARTVGTAREGTARDAGEASMIALRERARARQPLDSAGLAELLEDERPQGLRYIALLGDDARVLASAGTPLGMSTAQGTFEEIDDRVRMVRRAPVWRGRRPWGQGSAGSAGSARGGIGSDARSSGAGIAGSGSDAAAAAAAADDDDGPPPPLPPPGPPDRRLTGVDAPVSAVVVEFEPLVANQLRDEVRILAIVISAASLVVVGFAIWMLRGARQRERLQVELERGRRLAALGEMSSVIAHEVKNPLASLKGHAQLLVEALPETGPARTKADRVVNEATRLERLTTDLLDFVRSGALRREDADARAMVDDVVAELGADRIDVVAVGETAHFSLDVPRLRQAVVNVVQNALQASPADGRVELELTGARSALVIKVRDRGPGIPAGEEKQIFEPFHTRRTKGIGLGLAIARRMVELHGGTIEAGARDGGGAEVTIVIPRKAQA